MNCDGVRDLLSAYIDGELSAGELLRVEQHLRRCHCCADDVDSLRQAIALVTSLEEVEVPATFHAQLHDRLVALGPAVAARRSTPAVASRRNQRRWAMPAAAAAAVAALAIGVSAYTQNGSGLPEGLLGPSVLVEQPSIKVTQNQPGDVAPQTGEVTPQADPGTKPNPGSSAPPTSNNVAGNDPDPAPPGLTTPDGPIRPATPTQVEPGQPVALKAQMAVVYEVTVQRDVALLTELRTAFPVRNEAADQISISVPVASVEDELARVQAIYPAVQPKNLSIDLAASIDQIEQRIASLDLNIRTVQSMPKEEQEPRAQQVGLWHADRDAAAEELVALRTQVRNALIVVKFQNP